MSLPGSHERAPAGATRLIITTGDISDVDGFYALRKYAEQGADVMFVMNYPAYLQPRIQGAIDGLEQPEYGLGFAYGARDVLAATEGAPARYSDQYRAFMRAYDWTGDHAARMRHALTDLAFLMARGVWDEAPADRRGAGRLLFCIGGINSVSPFAAASVKDEVAVYSVVFPPPAQAPVCRSDAEGLVYVADGEGGLLEDLDWGRYQDIYLDFNGSAAFLNAYWMQTLRRLAPRIRGVFMAGGVLAEEAPRTMPAIPGVLNRYSCATMNQLYRPSRTGELLDFVRQYHVPLFVVTNNAVPDLALPAGGAEGDDGVRRFLHSNGLEGPFLAALADAYYGSPYPAPRKAFDYYTALALVTALQQGTGAVPAAPRALFYSRTYGVALVSTHQVCSHAVAAYYAAAAAAKAGDPPALARFEAERERVEAWPADERMQAVPNARSVTFITHDTTKLVTFAAEEAAAARPAPQARRAAWFGGASLCAVM